MGDTAILRETPSILAVDQLLQSAALGSLDNDETPDVFLLYGGFVSGKLVVLDPGSVTASPMVEFSIPGEEGAFTVADFNQDGFSDFAVTIGFFNSHLAIYINDQQRGFNEVAQVAIGTNPRDVVASDFDADGDFDLAVTNDLATVSIIENLGENAFFLKSTAIVALERVSKWQGERI